MDISELAEEIGERLNGIGWHLDLKQKRCPKDDCNRESYRMEKTFCPYCGGVLSVDEGSISDLEEVLRDISEVKHKFG